MEKVDKVPLKKVKTNKTYNLILHKINFAKFLGANTMMLMYNVLTGCKANKNIDAKKAHKKATIIQSN